MDKLVEKYPTIQISTPNYIDVTANKKSYSKPPLVAYVTDSDAKSIIAFDTEGVEHTLTNDEIPDRPVIVISESERVVAVKKDETLSSYYQEFCPEPMQVANSEYKYFKLYACDNGGGSGGGGSTPTRPHRNYNSKVENIYKLRFNSMRDKREYESWWRGDAEVMVKAIFVNSNNSNPVFSSITKHKNGGFIDVKWWGESFVIDNVVNIPLDIYWNKSEYGDRMKYIFYEMDNKGGELEINVSVTAKIAGVDVTVGGTYKIKSKDLNMGESILYYNDDTKGDGKRLNTGSFSAWINQ